MTVVFHEIAPESVGSSLTNGIVLGKKGTKTDQAIHATDQFLDTLRPQRLARRGVSRVTNNYCYLVEGDDVISIVSGEKQPITEFLQHTDQAVLRVEVDPRTCYVSDLDLFDEIKSLRARGDTTRAQQLGATYWQHLQLLADYDGTIRRPEVMVPCNIPPTALRRVA